MNTITSAAHAYDESGFQVVPVNGKELATKGVTGWNGTTDSVFPRDGQNVALRLPRGLIGIDVDAYGDKPGFETLKDCYRKFGPLPKTDRSGSRNGHSGIYLYRVPEDYEAISKLPGIEFIQHHHRYMVVEPSVHPDTGDVYKWHPVGDSPMWLNGPESFPKLPDPWLEGLRKNNASNASQKRSEGRVEGFLTDGSPCDEVTAVLDKYNERTGNGESHYDSMISAQYRLMKLGEAGHPGVSAAMDTLESLYVPAREDERDTQGEWNRGLDGLYLIADEPSDEGDPCEVNPLNLPDRFWNSRESLKHIRQAAHSQTSSADVVLYATLTRMSAMIDHRTRVVTGVKNPASLNTYSVIVGGTGVGKSSGASASRGLIPVPIDLEGYREIGLGSGEGMIEAFMGEVFEETGETTKDGKPKVARMRKQVRHNTLFIIDEGAELNKQMERSGSTIAPILRSAWVGETMGQANANKENSRNLPAGSYALGLTVGYQMNTASALLTEDEIEAGTPQRFLWVWAEDPSIPRKRIDHPGELTGYALKQDDFVESTGELPHLHFPDDLKDQMWEHMRALATGESRVENPLNSHENLTRAKVAALLALLDGRFKVSHEDWELSGVIWETSCAVRDHVHNAAIESAKRDKERAANERISEAKRTALATSNIGAKTHKTAASLAKKVHDKGSMGSSELRKTMNSRKRDMFADALEYAEDQGWLCVDEEGRVSPGDTVPE
ncbi:bifunctional DNA primase/polymerase [Nocardiopsis dassonvillei]|uniref:bifunctional DNA primase/polymerase n=1 Tax=Nocardiopsis dassonvillei TaxID=2014 RepID=UPI00200C8BD6|nr:bifunctional DNA primase/polymerase [Nocardiopsis dassonvillei]MCK9870165.1 bifunctional DNA primase/polymerase [Nocardiopsis dassonvillei]